MGRLRSAIAGAFAAFTAVALVVAFIGGFDDALAGQTLAANGRFHAAVAAAVLGMAVALAGWRAVGACAFVAGVWLAFAAAANVQWKPVAPIASPTARIDLVIFNAYAHNRRGERIADWLETELPDVVLLLEARPLAPYLERLRATYPNQVGCKGEDCEILLLSRLPLTDAIVRDLPSAQDRFVAARVGANGAALWIFAAHWGKFYFTPTRRDQAAATLREVRRRIRRDDAPFVLAGDFNATQWDPSVGRLARQLGAAHPAVWMPTWPIRLGPFGGQIDHVLTPGAVAVEAIEYLPRELGSNHRGLRVRLAIPRPEGAHNPSS